MISQTREITSTTMILIRTPVLGLYGNHPRLKARACDCGERRRRAKRMRQKILNHVTRGLFRAALPDILGSVDIGMRLVSAGATPKVLLITAVALLTVATMGARPAGVARKRQTPPGLLPRAALSAIIWRNCQNAQQCEPG